MKTAFKILLLMAVAGYLVFAVVSFAQPTEELVCEAVDIRVTDHLGGFVTEDYIHEVLRKGKIQIEGQKVCNINLHKIEQTLLSDPYIEEATCYTTACNNICINVTPQHPVLHVMAENGENYYLDNNGLTMPTGIFNVDLCIASGHISKQFAKDQLVALANYILEHDFWNEQIEQIYVVSPNDIELFPRVGNHVIKLGSAENFQDKLNRLFIFYQKGLSEVGWNKYQTINLAYNKQVVCTKRNKIKE